MTKKQKIPCRVCGKLFEPCAYCKSHGDVFRWRNFACSKGCAKKYIQETTEYRESLRSKREAQKQEKTVIENPPKEKASVERKRTSKKSPNDTTDEKEKTD